MNFAPQTWYKQVKYFIWPFYKLMGPRFVKDLEHQLGASGLDNYRETLEMARRELEAGEA